MQQRWPPRCGGACPLYGGPGAGRQFTRRQSDPQLHQEWRRRRCEVAGRAVTTVEGLEVESGDREHGRRLLGQAIKARDVLRRYLSDPKHVLHLSEEQIRHLKHGVQQIDGYIDQVSNRNQAA